MSIQLENLKFSYFEDRKDVLSGISAEFDASRITILTGASGCGKSTLLYLAAGIYPHSAGVLRTGTVSVEGREPESLPPPKRCQLVGMMFQNPELQFCMDTSEHEILFCLENIGMEPGQMEERMEEALAFCDIKHLRKRTLQSLSGGERQKVMLACLAALSPKWILLDEPFANIDDDSARSIAEKLKRLNRERGTGILAVDHRLDNWQGVADVIRVMEDGQLLPEELELADLPKEALKRLGVAVPGQPYCERVQAEAKKEEERPGEPILELKGVSLFRGKKQILREITASFYSGRIYAIVGESGCGKSSLFGALSGLYPYQGEVLLEGRNIRRLRKKDLGRIGFVTQNPQDQFVCDTVWREIRLGLRGEADAEKKGEEILRGIRLWRYRDISPYLLSQGQQRRLGVAALLAYPCRVLVCDEPTYAQDGRNTMAIMEALCRQAREEGVALIFSTHDRQAAKDYADEILELKEGRMYANAESGH